MFMYHPSRFKYCSGKTAEKVIRPKLPVCGGERATGLRGSAAPALRAIIAAIEKSVALVLPSSATILSPPATATALQHSALATSIKHFSSISPDLGSSHRTRPHFIRFDIVSVSFVKVCANAKKIYELNGVSILKRKITVNTLRNFNLKKSIT